MLRMFLLQEACCADALGAGLDGQLDLSSAMWTSVVVYVLATSYLDGIPTKGLLELINNVTPVVSAVTRRTYIERPCFHGCLLHSSSVVCAHGKRADKSIRDGLFSKNISNYVAVAET